MKSYLLFLPLGLFALQAASQTIQLVLVSNYEDPKLGLQSIQSENEILKIFKTVEFGISYKTQITYLNRDRFTADPVRKALHALKLQPKDIVFLSNYLGTILLDYQRVTRFAFKTPKIQSANYQHFKKFANFYC